MRLCDIHLEADPPLIHVSEGAKNVYRVRDLPLNEAAALAIGELLTRAIQKGASSPNHYLLPARFGDATKHMGSWRKAWDSLRKAAGMPKLRMYDLRHHAITRLLESEHVSERTVIELAGHVSKQMLNRYSHIRMHTKAEAVNALEADRKKRARESALRQLEVLQKRIANEPTEQARKAAYAIQALLDGNDPGETS